jgi:hypothetical protein
MVREDREMAGEPVKHRGRVFPELFYLRQIVLHCPCPALCSPVSIPEQAEVKLNCKANYAKQIRILAQARRHSGRQSARRDVRYGSIASV